MIKSIAVVVVLCLLSFGISSAQDDTGLYDFSPQDTLEAGEPSLLWIVDEAQDVLVTIPAYTSGMLLVRNGAGEHEVIIYHESPYQVSVPLDSVYMVTELNSSSPIPEKATFYTLVVYNSTSGETLNLHTSETESWIQVIICISLCEIVWLEQPADVPVLMWHQVHASPEAPSYFPIPPHVERVSVLPDPCKVEDRYQNLLQEGFTGLLVQAIEWSTDAAQLGVHIGGPINGNAEFTYCL